MSAKINFITLAVENILRARDFYTVVFGFPLSDQTNELCLFALDDHFYLALQQRLDFAAQTQSRAASGGFILTYKTASAVAVEKIVGVAEKLGATRLETLDEAWGYSVTFRDLDGHHWEILHQDEA